MDQSGGWVRVYRALLQTPIWTQLAPAVLKVAMYFILKANYKPDEWYDGAEQIPVPRGSFVTSYRSAAAECKLSIQQTRDAFAHLARTHFATYRTTHRWTLVTVTNYEIYQPIVNDENAVKNALGNGKGTTDKEIKKKEHKCASPDGGVSAAKESPKTNIEEQQRSWFDQWWGIYWRREDRKRAWGAFRTHVRTAARFQQVMAATQAQRPQMLTKESCYRPLGATWLNNERWEDETTETRSTAAQDDYPEL